MMCFVDVREEGDWGGGRVKAGEERDDVLCRCEGGGGLGRRKGEGWGGERR